MLTATGLRLELGASSREPSWTHGAVVIVPVSKPGHCGLTIVSFSVKGGLGQGCG